MSQKFSIHHSFDVDLAKEYGIECALLIHHFQHWIRVNQHNPKAQKDGRTWTYQTLEYMLEHFPYWTIDMLRNNIRKLVSLGILMRANHSDNSFNRTSWYAFVSEEEWVFKEMFSKRRKSQMDAGETQNGSVKSTACISIYPKEEDSKDSSNARAREGSEILEGRIAESAADAATAAASSEKTPKQPKTETIPARKPEVPKVIIPPAAAPPPPDCLRQLNLTPEDISWITETYDQVIIEEAVRWTKAKEQAQEIKTSLVQCLKHGCAILQKGGILSFPKTCPNKAANESLDEQERIIYVNKKLARQVQPHLVQKNPNSAPTLAHPAFFSMRDGKGKWRQIEWFRSDFAKILSELCGFDIESLRFCQ